MPEIHCRGAAGEQSPAQVDRTADRSAAALHNAVSAQSAGRPLPKLSARGVAQVTCWTAALLIGCGPQLQCKLSRHLSRARKWRKGRGGGKARAAARLRRCKGREWTSRDSQPSAAWHRWHRQAGQSPPVLNRLPSTLPQRPHFALPSFQTSTLSYYGSDPCNADVVRFSQYRKPDWVRLPRWIGGAGGYRVPMQVVDPSVSRAAVVQGTGGRAGSRGGSWAAGDEAPAAEPLEAFVGV